jgi:hypothetical protein
MVTRDIDNVRTGVKVSSLSLRFTSRQFDYEDLFDIRGVDATSWRLCCSQYCQRPVFFHILPERFRWRVHDFLPQNRRGANASRATAKCAGE